LTAILWIAFHYSVPSRKVGPSPKEFLYGTVTPNKKAVGFDLPTALKLKKFVNQTMDRPIP
jgi:hypothetical protein